MAEPNNQTLRGLLGRLLREEGGAEGLEKLLIIAAVVLPLLGLLVVFRDKISEWVSGQYDTVKSDADQGVTTPQN